jgi:hypothetical protein
VEDLLSAVEERRIGDVVEVGVLRASFVGHIKRAGRKTPNRLFLVGTYSDRT